MHTLLRQALGATAMAVVILPVGVRAEEASAPTLEGIWHERGCGNILSIKEGASNYYEVTSIRCLNTDTGSFEDLGDELDIDSMMIADGGDRLWVLVSGSAAPTAYDRVQALPHPCGKGGTTMTSNLQLNFDILWRTVAEYHVF